MQGAFAMAEPSPNLEDEVTALHAQHAGLLLRYARSVTSDEETAREGIQEVFLRYFIERSYGRGITYPKAWLFEVLRNYLHDQASLASAQREVPFEWAEMRPDLSPNAEAAVGGMQTAERIAESLSEREFECLRLRVAGMSYGEIGEAMQVRIGTVGALLTRAHDKIRKLGGAESSGVVASAVFQLIQERPACTLT